MSEVYIINNKQSYINSVLIVSVIANGRYHGKQRSVGAGSILFAKSPFKGDARYQNETVRYCTIGDAQTLCTDRCVLTGVYWRKVYDMSRNVKKRTVGHVRLAKIQVSLIRHYHWVVFGKPRMQRFFMRTKKIQLRLRGSAGWFESYLVVQVRRSRFLTLRLIFPITYIFGWLYKPL